MTDRRSPHFREPFAGISHLVGAALALVALAWLLGAAHGRPGRLASFAIYGATLVLLYLASGLYHSVGADGRALAWLRRLDHAAIYLLIAGTYVPICVLGLPVLWGSTLLAIEGTLAVVGTVAALARGGGPSWLRATLYVVMGWVAVVALGPLEGRIGAAGVAWLLAGGIVYTVGAVIYVTGLPRLWPGRFGSHELWHVFVLGGSACHFVLIAKYLPG